MKDDGGATFHPYDELIVDEAQDFLRGDYLDFLDCCVTGGLSGGRVKLFGDFELISHSPASRQQSHGPFPQSDQTSLHPIQFRKLFLARKLSARLISSFVALTRFRQPLLRLLHIWQAAIVRRRSLAIANGQVGLRERYIAAIAPWLEILFLQNLRQQKMY